MLFKKSLLQDKIVKLQNFIKELNKFNNKKIIIKENLNKLKVVDTLTY